MNRRNFIGTNVALAANLLAACATNATEGTSPTFSQEPRTPTQDASPSGGPEQGAAVTQSGRVLMAYFSRAGENYYYGGRTTLEVGNTQVVADTIAAVIDVDIFRIEPADPYPESYAETVARNVREEDQDARPQIANALPDVTGYDTVLLGSPVWNVQTPMIMRTFVEGIDLAGKTIHPFVTFAVSGMGRVERDYARLCPDATMGEGLAVQGEEAAAARPDIEAWLRQIDLSS